MVNFGGAQMLINGERQKEVIRPKFNRAIMIDFRDTRITSDVGFLLVREITGRSTRPRSGASPAR